MEIHFFFRLSQGNLKASQGYGTLHYYITQKNRTIAYDKNTNLPPSSDKYKNRTKAYDKGKKVYETSTGISLNASEWDNHQKCFTGNSALTKNLKLDKIKLNFENILGNENANQSDLRNFIDSINPPIIKLKRFIEVFDEYLYFQSQKIRKPDEPRTENTIEKGTYYTYEKRYNNINLFLQYKNRLGLNVGKFDGLLCEEFDRWFTNPNNPLWEKKPNGQAYSTKHLKMIRAVLDFAIRKKYILVNESLDYKLKYEKERAVDTLSNGSIEILTAFDGFTPTEQKYVDAFLFMRECCLHVGDYYELADEHIFIDENKQLWIRKMRVKRLTDDGRQIQFMPLSKKAIEILNKYDRNYSGELSMLPRAKAGSIIYYLRMACLRANITEHITLKFARSNGISHLYNDNKTRGELIAIGAGWTTTKPLKNYLKVDFEQMRREILNIA